jgi:recombination protein RecR
MNYPQTLQNLINSYKKLPGIGEKTAERMALFTLELSDEQIKSFGEAILNLKSKTKKCVICNNYTEEDKCLICKDKKREKEVLCIVEEAKNIYLIEKTGSYNGKYYVLGGLLSPLDGITPEELNINKLIDRIEKENIKEIIMAVKPSIEGETTALYIKKRLENKDVVVSKIASGVPLGAEMEYIDPLTLELAIDNRKKISSNE